MQESIDQNRPESSGETPPPEKRGVMRWVRRLGFWGFMFFFVKGLLWLAIPALLAWGCAGCGR